MEAPIDQNKPSTNMNRAGKDVEVAYRLFILLLLQGGAAASILNYPRSIDPNTANSSSSPLSISHNTNPSFISLS